MTKALWTVEEERKEEERRSKNVLSGLEPQPGIADMELVSKFCEDNLTIKPQIIRTRRFGNCKMCVTLNNSTSVEDLIASSRILRASPTTKKIFINPDLSKRQAELAYLKRQERLYKPEIFSVIETWLTPNDPDSLFFPPGYVFVRWDRETRGGGVAFIIKDTVPYRVVSVSSAFSHIEIVSIDIAISNKNYRFISYYRSGGFDMLAEKYAFDSAQCIKELCKGDINCLMGDFNLPNIDWINYSAPNNCIYDIFMDLFSELGLHQL
ncbi:hypothetical protein HELRODRAFT_184634, partial [Helobdella robusta]|uniref:Endonuclease/exonuclease/phosphatase domain-containing protein n=1 Tax=Helobdella robusta TaxID=6412 RepID=T1FLM7_HELRO